jgi:hypothetical protein
MVGENNTLFDISGFQNDSKSRKKPQSEAEKRLNEIREMQNRDFKNLQNKLFRGNPLTAAEAKRLEGYEKELRALTDEDLPEHVVTSKEVVAKYYGVTKRTIVNWSHREKPMPQMVNGYDLVAIGTWALEEGLISDPGLIPGNGNVSAKGDCNTEPENSNSKGKNFYETEIKRLESELREHKLKIAKEEYFLRSDVAKEWAARMAEVSRGLDYLSNRLPPLLIGKTEDEMQLIINNETWEIRDHFARTGSFCPSEIDKSSSE